MKRYHTTAAAVAATWFSYWIKSKNNEAYIEQMRCTTNDHMDIRFPCSVFLTLLFQKALFTPLILHNAFLFSSVTSLVYVLLIPLFTWWFFFCWFALSLDGLGARAWHRNLYSCALFCQRNYYTINVCQCVILFIKVGCLFVRIQYIYDASLAFVNSNCVLLLLSWLVFFCSIIRSLRFVVCIRYYRTQRMW